MLSQIKSEMPEAAPDPEVSDSVSNGNQKLRKDKLSVAIEKKGRGGKIATIIYGFTGDDHEVAETAALLKQKLATGGSSRGGEILLQGDVREKIKPLLKEMGYRL